MNVCLECDRVPCECGPTVGALFAGYGGIELALHEVFGARPAWFSEFDKAPSAILAHHWPTVPNLGDITKVDWSQAERPKILTGGSPCQDLSGAGKRGGMTEGTRSNLWVSMREAVATLRPELVIWENVRGAFSARADSDVEREPGLLGVPNGKPALRALGRVLGDLSSLGYDTAWTGLLAADVGAPHNRFRVFVLAWLPGAAVSDADITAGRERWLAAPGQAQGGRSRSDARGRSGALAATGLTLLPTPAVNDMGRAYTPETWDAWTERMKAAHANGNGHGKSLSIEALRTADFGQYAPAIARWEALTRPAPAPTEPTGRDGAQRLSPGFVEWLMGLPAGHVTDVPGISRNDQLKALGNGVVPQQAATAIRHLLGVRAVALGMTKAVA